MLIDNRNHVYIKVLLKCGVSAHCRPEVFATNPDVLSYLDQDLNDCISILPHSVSSLVKRTKFWVNVDYQYGPIEQPRVLKNATTHHHMKWLIGTRDNPEKTHGVEIYNCAEYKAMRHYWNGCGLILHELCHLIHQLVVDDGLENEKIKIAYETAVQSCKYEKVLRRDWAGFPCNTDMAYAMINHKEFFAEMSVSYLCTDYDYIDIEADIYDIEACSPEFRDSLDTHDTKHNERDSNNTWWENIVRTFRQQRKPKKRHCNKFFPFTRGQLAKYDPGTFLWIDIIFQEIAMWDDPQIASDKCKLTFCWPSLAPTTRNGNKNMVQDKYDNSKITSGCSDILDTVSL